MRYSISTHFNHNKVLIAFAKPYLNLKYILESTLFENLKRKQNENNIFPFDNLTLTLH